MLNQEIARSFFRRVVERAEGLMSDEHFTVDGTLIEAWASQKSFQRKDGGTDGDGSDFRGQQRKNDTHASKTDPDARLYRKSNGAESRLAYLGHLLIENRHGLIADAMATIADGFAEREAATLMMHEQWQRAPWRRRTVGADKAYDTRDFVDLMRELDTTPHVTQNLARPGGSAIDGRTTRHDGYAMSQHARPRIEPAFGWLKTIAWIRKVKLRGLPKVDWLFVFASAAFNLIRLAEAAAATGMTRATCLHSAVRPPRTAARRPQRSSEDSIRRREARWRLAIISGFSAALNLTLQVTSPLVLTPTNAQDHASGNLVQTRLTPQNAGFGAATGAQAMRSVQAQIRFQF